MSDGYRRVERFDPDYVQAMVHIGTSCDDRGAEGCPRCVKPYGHPGDNEKV